MNRTSTPADARLQSGCRLLTAALGALLLAISCLGCAPRRPPEAHWHVNESAESQGWRVSVAGLATLPPDPHRRPQDGHAFVSVHLRLENETTATRYVMPERQMTLLDGDGHVYAPDRDAAVVAARAFQWLIPEGAFPPGAIAEGAVSYQIPLAAQDVRWVFRTSLLPGAQSITFLLGDMPWP